MTPSEKAKAGWRAGCSQDAGTRESGSGIEHSRRLESWRVLHLIGVALATWALDRYSRTTDDPAPGAVEAADCLDAAADFLRPCLRRGAR